MYTCRTEGNNTPKRKHTLISAGSIHPVDLYAAIRRFQCNRDRRQRNLCAREQCMCTVNSKRTQKKQRETQNQRQNKQNSRTSERRRDAQQQTPVHVETHTANKSQKKMRNESNKQYSTAQKAKATASSVLENFIPETRSKINAKFRTSMTA